MELCGWRQRMICRLCWQNYWKAKAKQNAGIANRSKFKQKYLISYNSYINSYMLKMKCSNICRMVKGRLATPKCLFHIATHTCTQYIATLIK